MGRRQKKIYFVHQALKSFAKKDLAILEQDHKVKVVNNFNSTIYKIPQNFLKVLWCDVVFCWFGSMKFLVPIVAGKLLKKKVVIVAGGYDVVDLPEISYGSTQGRLHSWFQKELFKMADRIICISNSNMKEAINNVGISPEKITMIYHGFDSPKISKSGKENLVITTGEVNEENLLRKGIGLFFDVARFFPDIPFICIGSIDNGARGKILGKIPPNVTLTGWVSDKELEDYFNRAKVYVQASMHEGFGCSVAEAMLYECIPVVSNCFALPEVVGDAGYLVKPGNLEDLREKIAIALEDGEETGKKARIRVQTLFSIEQRRNALLSLIDSL